MVEASFDDSMDVIYSSSADDFDLGGQQDTAGRARRKVERQRREIEISLKPQIENLTKGAGEHVLRNV